MTEMTPFEHQLGRALNDYLGPRRPVDARAISRAAVAARATGSRWSSRLPVAHIHRLVWLVVIGLTLVAVLALAFGVGRQQPRPTSLPSAPAVPTNPAAAPPTETMQGSPTPATVPGLIPVDGPYVAVLTRNIDSSTFDVLVVDAAGKERIVDTVSVAPKTLDYISPQVSNDGWLYVSSSDAIDRGFQDSFYDLSRPSLKPWTQAANAQAAGPRWGPNGLLATDNGNRFIDPRTQHIWTPSNRVFLGAGPVLIWSADGLGAYNGSPQGIGIQPLDGAPFVPGRRQSWSPDGARVVGQDGSVLCDWALVLGLDSSGCSSLHVGVVNDSGPVEWARDLPNGVTAFSDDAVVGTSFAAMGRAVWTIGIGSGTRVAVELLRYAAPDTLEAAVSLSPSDLPFTIDASTKLGFVGFAPDDSALVIADYVNGISGTPVYVRTDNDLRVAVDGSLAGFVPASMAAGWPTVSN